MQFKGNFDTKYTGADSLLLDRVENLFRLWYYRGDMSILDMGYLITRKRSYYDDLKLFGNKEPYIVLDRYCKMRGNTWSHMYQHYRIVHWNEKNKVIYLMSDSIEADELEFYPRSGIKL